MSKFEISRIVSVVLTIFLAEATARETPPTRETPQATAKCDSQVRSTYLLGPNDELEFSGLELDDAVAKTSRIDGNGYIQLPMVGRVRVGGLTVQQAEQELNNHLSTYFRNPQVAINVKELRSQPVSVLGAVNSPGVHQVRGQKTLLEMLSLAGGMRSDAGYSVRITRQLQWGCVPLPNAKMDATGQFSVGEVNLKDIMAAKKPEENIQILPHDVVSVPKAEMVYIIGEVRRSGGFVLGEHESLSILQALSLAEGLNGTADARRSRILRLNPGASRRVEIPVDVKGILTAKKEDVPLQGDDILFIPSSTGKKAALRAIEAAIQTGTGLAVFRRP